MTTKNYYSLFSDERDEKIAELEEKLSRCTCSGSGGGGGAGFGIPFNSEVQQELNYLENCLREEKARNDEVSDEVDVLRLTNEKLMTAITKANIVAVEQEQMENLKKALDVRNQDLAEAKMLIEEMRHMISSRTDAKAVELNKFVQQLEELRKARDEAIKEGQAAKEKIAGISKKDVALQQSLKELQLLNKEIIDKTKANAAEREKSIKQAQEKWQTQSERRMAMEKRRIEQLEYDLAQCKLRMASPGDMVFASDTPLPPAPGAKKAAAKKEAAAAAAAASGKKDDGKAAAAAAPAAGGGGLGPEAVAQLNLLKKQNLDLLDKLKAATESGNAGKNLTEEVNFLKKKLAEKDKEIEKVKKEIKNEAGKVEAGKVVELEKKIKALEADNKRLTEAYQTELVLRKKYYNMVEDMKGKIRVYCRIRPISKSETERGNKNCVTVPDEYTLVVDTGKGKKDFQYDRVFAPDEQQEAVFVDVENLIQSAFDGYNVCIFAYGQTGSGKTHTMVGDPVNNPGIAPRSFKKIFQSLKANTKVTCDITVYMLELYNDKLLDLLANNAVYSDKLEIKKDSRGLVVVPGTTITNVKSDAELAKVFDAGVKNRHTASTKMNSESSRSHLVISILIESTDKQTKKVTTGKLSIIDLAGSERISKSGVTDDGAKEANAINMSLSALGDVISALTSEATFIPYRNNKLTMLMQDSLGGNAKTLMFVNCSPVDYNALETVNSLNYASRVKLIKNDATKNSDSAEVDRLKKIIARLQKGEKVDVI